jgi:hypothetical protein
MARRIRSGERGERISTNPSELNAAARLLSAAGVGAGAAAGATAGVGVGAAGVGSGAAAGAASAGAYPCTVESCVA